MKVSTPFLRFLLVFAVVLTAAWVFAGCSKKEEGKQEDGKQNLVTIDNLQASYGAEVKRVGWYENSAAQAQKERLGDIAVLFKSLARSEKVHVDAIAKLLRTKGVEPVEPAVEPLPDGKAKQYLKLAASNENVEQSMLAAAMAKAEEEKVPEAVELFRRLTEADARHGRLLKKAIDQESNFARLPYLMCPECGYIVGSDKLDECPVCKTKKDQFQQI